MWDQTFRLPTPPVDAIAPAAFSYWCTIFYGLIAFGGLLYALYHWRVTGRPVLILLLCGAGLTVFVEPFLDLMGAAWHPRYGHDVAFELMGRPIPWWMVSAYFAYFGVLGAWNYRAFERGVTMNRVRLWFLAPMVADIVIEQIMLSQGLYIYYGQQPLVLGYLPLWWVICNSLGEFIGVTMVLMMAPYLKGWKLLLILVVVPVSDTVGYAVVAMPSWIVINTPVPGWAVQIAGISTFLLAFLVVHLLSLVIATDSPLRRGKASPQQVLAGLAPGRT